ncbi:MAG: serine hydrolase domain-containing protein [Akkermansiaceae bacterium]
MKKAPNDSGSHHMPYDNSLELQHPFRQVRSQNNSPTHIPKSAASHYLSRSNWLLLLVLTFCLSLRNSVQATDFQSGNVFTRNIPEECREKLHEYAQAKHKILCVSFPPGGENRWTIVTDRLFFNRNTPAGCHEKMWEFRRAGHEILCVAYPPAGGWAIITDRDFFAQDIPVDCENKMQELKEAGNPVTWLSFRPEGGNRWGVITRSGSFFNQGTGQEIHEKMWELRNSGHKVRSTVFHPEGGNRWAIVTDRGFFQWQAGEENFRVMRAMSRCLEAPLEMVSFHPEGGFVIASTRQRGDGERLVFMEQPSQADYLDLDNFAENLQANLSRDSIGKFAFVIRHGDSLRTWASGEKRTASSPPAQAFTIYDRFNPASVSKWVSAIGIIHALQEMANPGETIEDLLNRPILPYLPPSWNTVDRVANITFKEVLSHRTGLRNRTNGECRNGSWGVDPDHEDVREALTTVGQHWDPENENDTCYENLNYGLARVLLAGLAGYRGSIPEEADADEQIARQFRNYLQEHVFDPCGIWNVQFEPDSSNPTVFYPVPAGNAAGKTIAGDSLAPGSSGIFLSVAELSILINQVTNSNTILTSESQAAMDDNQLGWHPRPPTQTTYGKYWVKPGFLPYEDDGIYLRSVVMKFENGVEISAIANTAQNIGTGFEASIKEVYEASWQPLPSFMAAWRTERDSLQSSNTALSSLANALASEVSARDATINELSQRPTRADYDALAAERDARFTEDQIRALSADYTIGLNEAGNVQMKFNLFESADLRTFTPLTINPDSVSVINGRICLEFAPEDRAAFFRFNVE